MSSSFGQVRTLATPSGDLSISVIDQGLHVLKLEYKNPKTGLVSDVMIGSDDPAKQVDGRRFMHCAIGRYCNRLPSGANKFSTPSGESTFTPEVFGDPGTSLHGGPGEVGWDTKPYAFISVGEATLFTDAEKKSLQAEGVTAGVWVYESPDGEGGYPGKVRFEFAVVLSEEGGKPSVALVYRAKLLSGEATPLNLTHHWGFNLDASTDGKDGPTAKPPMCTSQNLTFKASRTLDLAAGTALPTGKTKSVEGTAHDFRSGKTIGDGYPSGGYDDFWVFDRAPSGDGVFPEADAKDRIGEVIKSSPEVMANLSSSKSGISIDFASNQCGVQSWTGHGGYDGSDARKKSHGGKDQTKAGDGYVEGSAIAMEFHEIYGAWQHPELAKLGWSTVLNKGEVYNNWVKCTFSSK